MTTVVVLGMHRSGTSMVAGVCHFLGIMMGEDLVVGNTKEQPGGYYEDRDIMMINERMLSNAGGGWSHPPDSNQLLDAGEQMAEEIKSLIKDRDSKYPIWGWKDPRTCLTLPAYMPHLAQPVFVVVKRDKESVVDSLDKRERKNMNPEKAAGLYDHYHSALIRHLQGQSYIIIYYEDFLRNQDIRGLAGYIGIRPSPEQLQAARQHVQPDLNRHNKWKLRSL